MLSFAIFFSKFGYAAIREILREIWVSVAKFRRNLGNIVHFGVSLECFYFQKVVLGVKMQSLLANFAKFGRNLGSFVRKRETKFGWHLRERQHKANPLAIMITSSFKDSSDLGGVRVLSNL